MSRTEPVTLTNMCMIQHGDKVLAIDRNDPVWPGLTFPGGHVEHHESFHDSVIREIKEETGLEIKNPKLVGVKQFYDHDNCRYLVFFYKAEEFSGKVRASDEGKLKWIDIDQMKNKELAYNFDRDLPVFLNDDLCEHMLDGNRDELF